MQRANNNLLPQDNRFSTISIISDVPYISNHVEFIANSQTRIFTHKRRKTSYYIVDEAIYMSRSIGYEDDKLFCIYVNTDILGIASLKTSTKKDFEPYPDLKLCYPGYLQCSIPINQNTKLVCYQSIDTKTIWYRPHTEFFDEGRFIEQGKP